MSNINKQELRLTAEKAKDNFMPNFMVPTRDLLALLDELESAGKRWAAQDDHINQQADRIEWLEQTNAGLGKALGAAEKRIAELERGAKVIKCWSCQKSVTVGQVTAADGYCPSCNCSIDLEDYDAAELVAAGIITKVGE